jgi:hypothetical protein
MKAILLKVCRGFGVVLTSAIVGWQLTYLIDLIPGNMPYPVDMFIRTCLSIAGHDELANPDDMEVLSLLLYWLMASSLVGALIILGIAALRRHRRKTSNAPL